MSEIYKVLEPRVNVVPDTEKTHMVLLGGQRVQQATFVADSHSNNGCNFSITPPSSTTIIDRYIRVRSYIEVSLQGGDLDLTSHDAFRQFPHSSILDVINVEINGETISQQIGSHLHAFLCYGNDANDRRKSWTTSPSMPDTYQEYNDFLTHGSAMNPLADRGENSIDIPRGAFSVQVINSSTVRIEVVEPIWISPFYAGLGHQVEGMVNVNSLNISMRYKQDLGRCFSHSVHEGDTVTGATASFFQAPELLMTFITPSLTQRLPEVQVLPYLQPVHYQRSVPQLAAGATLTVMSDTVRLSQIPKFLYLHFPHSEATKSFTVSDAFCAIERVSINWGNETNLLGNATKQDLYEISVRNGLNVSFPDFENFKGSVIAVEFGKDIGLLDFEAPSVQGSYNIQVQVDIKNMSSSPFTPVFNMSVINEGTFTIGPNVARASLGNLTPEMVLAARDNAPQVHHIGYYEIRGSGFWSGLKTMVHKIAHGVGKVAGPVATALGHPEMGAAVGNIARGVEKLTGSGRISGGSRPVLSTGRIQMSSGGRRVRS